jgi:CMP-N-acetylneuraminic acid synthetase
LNVALITARGGSKGLPRKNILPINGAPLISWTIDASLKANSINRVFVSTDDAEIAQISLKFGAEVIDRPEAISGDFSTSEDAVLHAINSLKGIGVNVRKICLLQPTSPLRKSSHIDKAFDVLSNKKCKGVVSVFESRYNAAKAYKISKDGTISGLLFSDAPYTPRQQLPNAYFPNGAIYLFTAESFLENNTLPRNNVYPLLMQEDESVDIDSLQDLKQAELLMKEKNYEYPRV